MRSSYLSVFLRMLTTQFSIWSYIHIEGEDHKTTNVEMFVDPSEMFLDFERKGSDSTIWIWNPDPGSQIRVTVPDSRSGTICVVCGCNLQPRTTTRHAVRLL